MAACSSSSDTQTPGATSAAGTGITAPSPAAGGTVAGAPTAGTGTGTAPRAGTSSPVATGGTSAATSGRGATTPATPTAGTGPAAAGGSGAPPAGGGPATTPPTPSGGAANVLEYHGNAKRTGLYVDPTFTRAAAAMIKKDAAFNATVAGPTYAQPLFWEGEGKDLVITATEQNEVTAFNAADASVVWRKTLAMPVSTGLPCGNIKPLGVTGTPVIDAASKTLYVAAMTPGPKHQVYALGLDDGEIKPGFPVDLSTVKAGSLAFNSAEQNQRGALTIVNNTLYIPYGGHYGDCGAYHGWVIGVPLNASGATPTGWATKAKAGGIWAPGGVASDGKSVYAATGNTMSDSGGILSSPATWGHGNAIVRLNPALANVEESATKDFFAPENWKALDQGDLDLGGSGPLLFSVPGATPSDLVLAFGKNGAAYLLSQENLGGMGGELDTKMLASGSLQGGFIQAATAYTTPTGTFVAFRTNTSMVMGCGSGSGYIGAFKIDAASPPKMSVAWCAGSSGNTSPIATSTDGMADTVVWYVAGGKLVGFNGENGMPVASVDGAGTTSKFQTPMAAKGRIYVAAGNSLNAFTVK